MPHHKGRHREGFAARAQRRRGAPAQKGEARQERKAQGGEKTAPERITASQRPPATAGVWLSINFFRYAGGKRASKRFLASKGGESRPETGDPFRRICGRHGKTSGIAAWEKAVLQTARAGKLTLREAFAGSGRGCLRGESGSGRRGGTYAAKATCGFGTGGPEAAGLAYRAGEEGARRFSCPERTNLV